MPSVKRGRLFGEEKSQGLISDLGHKKDALGHAGDEGRKGHERSRGAAKRALSRECPNGETPQKKFCDASVSKVAVAGKPRELKHLSTSRKRNQARDSPSSGERNGKRLNQET